MANRDEPVSTFAEVQTVTLSDAPDDAAIIRDYAEHRLAGGLRFRANPRHAA